MNEDFNNGRQYERRETYAMIQLVLGLAEDQDLRHTLDVWSRELAETLDNTAIEETDVYSEIQS